MIPEATKDYSNLSEDNNIGNLVNGLIKDRLEIAAAPSNTNGKLGTNLKMKFILRLRAPNIEYASKSFFLGSKEDLVLMQKNTI